MRLTSTASQPPNASWPTSHQNSQSPKGCPQPQRSPSTMPRCHMCTTSPAEHTPGSSPISRSSSVLPLRPRPPR